MSGSVLRSGFTLCIGSPQEFSDLAYYLQTSQQETVVRMIRGKNTRTLDALFGEFAAALQFPYYFGFNWPAYDECLSDLDWLPAERYLVMVVDGGSLLRAETIEIEVFFRLTRSAAEEHDRNGRRFQVLLHCTEAQSAGLREAASTPLGVVGVRDLKPLLG